MTFDPRELMDGWERLVVPNNPIVLWGHPKHGVYASGLFRLHDEIGFPLSCALDECNKYGWKPCLTEFVQEAIAHGWTRETAERTVAEAKADSLPSHVVNGKKA